LIICTILCLFHIFHLLYCFISLLYICISIILIIYWFLRRNVFICRLCLFSYIRTIKSSLRSLGCRLYWFCCRKRCMIGLLMSITNMWSIICNFIRWFFESSSFSRNIINSFRFSKSGFNKLLHCIFTFFHVWMAKTHLFSNGSTSFFGHIRSSGLCKSTGLGILISVILMKLIRIDGSLWYLSIK
jgi:hypothetical protein